MQLRCDHCNRDFEIDEPRAAAARRARCICGAILSLTGEQSGSLPRRLGKYELIERLAVGGMGEIYRGKIAGIEGFEREVAIKRMLPHLAQDKAFVDMMVKEAKLTVQLNHPNIVQVFDLGREGKDVYIAMEYVRGVTVAHLLQRAQTTGDLLPVELAVYITMQVLRGLSYAHGLAGADGQPMQILHRDITPQNILVRPDAWVKVTDFGIAKARNEVSTTSPGMIKGKLGYIAPEQLAGGVPDQRLDIFCAGILLWESLAAQRLFKGGDAVDTFRLIAATKIPPLSAFRDDVPALLEKALHGALTRLPEHRYKTADAFYDALSEAVAPVTVDELGAVSKRHLESHPELFELATREEDAATDETALHEEESGPTKVVEITALLPGRERRSHGGLWIAVAALLLAAAGLGAYVATRPPAALEASLAPTGGSSGPAPLSAEEVQLAVEGEKSRFEACYRAHARAVRQVERLEAKVVIPSTGGVAQVSLEPPSAELDGAGACIEEVLRALRFRHHAAPVFETVVRLPAPKAALAAVASGPRQAPAPAKPLTGAEVQSVVQRSSAGIAKCVNALAGAPDAPSQVNATVVINPSGRVSKVGLTPAVPHAVDACLRRALEALRFRQQPVKEFTVTIPLKIQVL